MKKENKTKRDLINCHEFTGYIDEMPQELKVAREARIQKQ